VFEYVEAGGERVKFRLGDEEMNVLGHDDVAEDVKLMAVADFLEFFEEGGWSVVVVEVGETAVTTKGDEVVMTLGLVTLEVGGHAGFMVSRG
jgi:lysylphosphatidylglycerol synthetase-like protein (DUF2156 family)